MARFCRAPLGKLKRFFVNHLQHNFSLYFARIENTILIEANVSVEAWGPWGRLDPRLGARARRNLYQPAVCAPILPLLLPLWTQILSFTMQYSILATLRTFFQPLDVSVKIFWKARTYLLPAIFDLDLSSELSFLTLFFIIYPKEQKITRPHSQCESRPASYHDEQGSSSHYYHISIAVIQ